MQPTKPPFRHTAQRRLVLAVVKLADEPLTAEEVFGRVRQKLRGVSVSTVYRNLDVLAQRGEIFRFVSPDGVSCFAGTVERQAYFTCSVCNETRSVTPSDSLSFFRMKLPHHQVFYGTTYLQGRCPDCLKKLSRSHASL